MTQIISYSTITISSRKIKSKQLHTQTYDEKEYNKHWHIKTEQVLTYWLLSSISLEMFLKCSQICLQKHHRLLVTVPQSHSFRQELYGS